MKKKFFDGLFLILFLGILNIYSQEGSFTLTVSNVRTNSNRAMVKIDNRLLNNNPNALVFVRRISGADHPIGVWYLNGNWHVVNRDQSGMVDGDQYQITFWTKPDASRFVHVVDIKNLKTQINGVAYNGISYIDHPALNKYPNASWSVMQSTPGYGNPNAVRGEYDTTAKKWYLVNENGAALLNLHRYNIAVFNSGTPDLAQSDLSNPQVRPGTDKNSPESNSATATTGIKTYFKTDPTIGSLTLPKEATQTNSLPSLEHTITVSKKSRLIIDASVLIGSGGPKSDGALRLKINGNVESSSYTAFSIAASTTMTVIINGFMTDVNPGTYRIEFEIVRIGSANIQSVPTRSSIIQIPIE